MVAFATAYYFVIIPAVIKYPTHEKITIELGDVPAGYTKTASGQAFLGLPAEYRLTWKLEGDLDKFSSVEVKVEVKKGGEVVASVTLTKNAPEASATIPAGEYTAVYTVTVTTAAELKEGKAIVSVPANLYIAITLG